MMRSPRNKTIELNDTERREYLEKCIPVGAYAGETDAVILGDTLEAMKKIKKGSVALAVADPPYNMYKEYGTRAFGAKNDAAYREYTEKWITALLPLLKKDASVYVCCDWRSGMIIGDVIGKYLTIRNRITWQREKGRGAAKNWKNGMEDIWYATVSDDYYFALDAVKTRRTVLAPYRDAGKPKDWYENDEGRFRDTCPSNFWDDISVPYWSMAENTPHPTQKPEKLMAKLILASSREGDLVFDPFAGSGTTAVTAKKLGRHWLAVEREEEYCALAEYRLHLANTDKTVQGYADGVFWERHTYAMQKKAENDLL